MYQISPSTALNSRILPTIFFFSIGWILFWITPSHIWAKAKPNLPALPAGISWHTGTVESAFTQAKKENKPLFLYWGAVWCPPCNQLKKTIFSTTEFQQNIQNFIPVYLDGDAPRAQIWAEKLKVTGYPTVLLLSPLEQEIMRIPSGLQLSEFIKLLNSAEKSVLPISTLLQKVLADTKAGVTSTAEWKLLAFYSWEALTKEQLENVKGQIIALAQKVPATEKAAGARLFLTSLKLQENRTIQQESEWQSSLQFLMQILQDKKLLTDNLESLSLDARTFVAPLYRFNPSKTSPLLQLWEEKMLEVQKDATLSTQEQLLGLWPSIEFHYLRHSEENQDSKNYATNAKKRPTSALKKLRQQVATRIELARKNSLDHYAHQAVISTCADLYEKVGLVDAAIKLLQQEIPHSHSPYYFMSYLGNLEKERGHRASALQWYEKAYQNATGNATRFQWGGQLLVQLMDLSPTSAEKIAKNGLAVFSELLQQEDAFSGRNVSRLQLIKEKMLAWGQIPQRQKHMQKILQQLRNLCAKSPTGAQCSNYFASWTL